MGTYGAPPPWRSRASGGGTVESVSLARRSASCRRIGTRRGSSRCWWRRQRRWRSRRPDEGPRRPTLARVRSLHGRASGTSGGAARAHGGRARPSRRRRRRLPGERRGGGDAAHEGERSGLVHDRRRGAGRPVTSRGGRAAASRSVTELPPDFRDLLVELHDAGADFVVVGGYAVAFHGHVRATKDIDVLVPSQLSARRFTRSTWARQRCGSRTRPGSRPPAQIRDASSSPRREQAAASADEDAGIRLTAR
jgi:hypothetical protein